MSEIAFRSRSFAGRPGHAAWLSSGNQCPQPSGAADEDPVELLKQGLRTYVNFGLTHPNHYRFGFLLQPADQPRRQPQRAAYESLFGKVKRCIAAKRFKTDDVECAAQSLWAAAHGITSLLIQRPGFPWAERDKLINQVLDSAVDGLLTQSIKRRGRRRTV